MNLIAKKLRNKSDVKTTFSRKILQKLFFVSNSVEENFERQKPKKSIWVIPV